MHRPLYHIELVDLLWLAPPVLAVGIIYARWTRDNRTVAYGTVRMVVQLILVGYVLTAVFSAKSPWPVVGVLGVMLTAASLIALRPLASRTPRLYLWAFLSVGAGALLALGCVLGGVLHLEVWYEPHVAVPLAGMLFANAMNAVSIAAERFESEARDHPFAEARRRAYKAALIPILNAFFAVGLVSLPGMMTGQILSGVDPLVAVRYQMMIMLAVFASAGIAAALFLTLRIRFTDD